MTLYGIVFKHLAIRYAIDSMNVSKFWVWTPTCSLTTWRGQNA